MITEFSASKSDLSLRYNNNYTLYICAHVLYIKHGHIKLILDGGLLISLNMFSTTHMIVLIFPSPSTTLLAACELEFQGIEPMP